MTAAALSYLLSQHGPRDPGMCRVCGAELTISSMGGDKATKYNCDSPEANGIDASRRDTEAGHTGFGPRWRAASDHRQASEVRITYHGDRRVCAALLEYRDLREALGENMVVPDGEVYYPDGHGRYRCSSWAVHVGHDRWEDHHDYDYTHDPSHEHLKVEDDEDSDA